MLVNTKKIVTEEVQIELKVPAYYKYRHGGMFYAIREDGSIHTVAPEFLSVIKTTAGRYSKELAEIMGETESSEAEFLAAYTTARMNTEYFLTEPSINE